MDTQLIWDNFNEALMRFIMARVRSRADAEDILQDVFIKIHDRTDQLQDKERLAGWVFRIASNATMDFYRAQRPQMDIPIINQDRDDLSREAAKTFSHCIKAFVHMLESPYKEAILWTEFEGLTQAQAAQRAGISVSGMKSRVQRGRLQLRGMIESCCVVETDARGKVIDYSARQSCQTCN